MQIDTPVYPADLMAHMGITHRNTLRQKIKAKAVPDYDVKLSAKVRYWHRSTLIAAGLMRRPADDQATKQPTKARKAA